MSSAVIIVAFLVVALLLVGGGVMYWKWDYITNLFGNKKTESNEEEEANTETKEEEELPFVLDEDEDEDELEGEEEDLPFVSGEEEEDEEWEEEEDELPFLPGEEEEIWEREEEAFVPDEVNESQSALQGQSCSATKRCEAPLVCDATSMLCRPVSVTTPTTNTHPHYTHYYNRLPSINTPYKPTKTKTNIKRPKPIKMLSKKLPKSPKPYYRPVIISS